MYYHVCLDCNAKFFTPKQDEHCPRCGNVSSSREQQTPPWQTSELERGYREQQARLQQFGYG